MSELHLPWLELAILLPLVGAGIVAAIGSPDRARVWTLGFLSASLLGTLGAWVDFAWLETEVAHDRWDGLSWISGRNLLSMDEFSAPMLALVSLLGLLTVLGTLKTKLKRVSFGGVLLNQALGLTIFSAHEPWLLIGLLSLSVLTPWYELVQRGKPTGVYLTHLVPFVLFLWAGWWLVAGNPEGAWWHYCGGVLLVLAVLLRSGVAPLHCWMTDLVEHAPFGSSILFVTPMAGAYAAVRLVVPEAPDWSLKLLVWAPMLTSLYAAGMALVQKELRRFFVYLFLSHASLVLVGLETATTEALAGGLSVWFATSLSLAGFGLTLRSVESRLGRISLADYHGLFEHMPTLAVLCLLTGLASVGFPGTIGFVATELLVDGVIHRYPWTGVAIVLAAALNGISVLKVYFRLFTGPRHSTSICLRARPAERLAVLLLVAVMIGGGIYPQPFLASRFRAAEHLLGERTGTQPQPMQQEEHEPEVEGVERTEADFSERDSAPRRNAYKSDEAALSYGNEAPGRPLAGLRVGDGGPRQPVALDDH
ncbi:MAG: proton-conducting transporter membrane subunit [Planctomycetota bacterium]